MSSPPASDRPTYNPDQINQFYDRISLPAAFRHVAGHVSAQVANDYHFMDSGHRYLEALTHHTLAAIPFENLSLHYSPHRSINISAPYLFDKIVANNNGRGGYCMENNAFFGTVLRTLGFNVTSLGARISSAVGNPTQPPNEVTYSGYSHMVNLVTFPNGRQCIVDVGFGRGGPTHPMYLEHDHPGYSGSSEYQTTRFLHQPINDTTDRSQKWWVYEKKHGYEGEWQPCYCFTTAEFLPQDFEVMNSWTSTSRASWFTWQVVCSKMSLGKGDYDEFGVVGDVTLFQNVLKRRTYGGESEVSMEIRTEEQRVKALERYSGVISSEAEREGIKGTVAAMRQKF